MTVKKAHILFSLAACICLMYVGASGRDLSGATITTTRVADNVYMLEGIGGNIGLFTGPDGIVLIDEQYAPLSDMILAAIRDITDEPLRFIVNTHWHPDHTGGNESLHAKTGGVIVAHENVRQRMSSEQFVAFYQTRTAAYPPEALPVVTFETNIRLHLNGDTVNISHFNDNGHTDSDSVVIIRSANVVHMGDLFFNGMYPFIDPDSNGSIDGVIAAIDELLPQLDDETRIIPGHGRLASYEDLQDHIVMLKTVRKRVNELFEDGQSRSQIIAAKVTADFDHRFNKGNLNGDDFVGILVDILARNRQ
jgi:glyoxylase-like metal-dependent hydrolase (beta-lactamase superfamily II)